MVRRLSRPPAQPHGLLKGLTVVRLFGGLTVLTMVGLTIGLASSVAVATGRLGAAKVTVQRCTSAGLGVTQNLSGSNVISITVSGLPAACGGATVQVTLNNLTTNSSGSSTVPAAGGSVTVALASAIAVTTSEQTDLVITGP